MTAPLSERLTALAEQHEHAARSESNVRTESAERAAEVATLRAAIARIRALEAERLRLREALLEIAPSLQGTVLSSAPDEQARFWTLLAFRYRDIARRALAPAAEARDA